ncbi:MAG: quinone-dependent dihydroorotate dehydrogenase [Candidatus Gracilibacteria bacterium]|jgi:dihydroorotate dehydrogenase subfamily 2
MKESIIKIRNNIESFLYKYFAKPIFFLIDPEDIHNIMIIFGRFLGSNLLFRAIVKFFFGYSNKILEQKILGVNFENPIGLAAGFDKSAQIIKLMKDTGFGFTEVGSITGEKCFGNPKPRLWRLKKSKGLVINYGLKNDGAEKIYSRLKNKKFPLPVFISIAKTNCKATAEMQQGIKDYLKSYKIFENIGDFDVLNISCPNAFGGEPFTKPENLKALLAEIKKIRTKKPILLKMPVDISDEQLDKIIEISREYKVDGFICSNLTKKRDNPKIIDKDVPAVGSISGKPIEEFSNHAIEYIYKKTSTEFLIIGTGGVFSAEDAYKKIKLGASLVQLITGMIFEGPNLISEINQGIAELLKKDGYKNIKEAVGKGLRNS